MENKAALGSIYQQETYPVLLCDKAWNLLYQNESAKRLLPALKENAPLQPQLMDIHWDEIAVPEEGDPLPQLYTVTVDRYRYSLQLIALGENVLLQFLNSRQWSQPEPSNRIEALYRVAVTGIFQNIGMLRTIMENEEQYDEIPYLDQVDKYTYRALRGGLVLSEYEKIKSGSFELGLKPVDLVPYLHELGRTISQMLFRNEEINFSMDLLHGDLLTMMDHERFSMMILEIVDNACWTRMGRTEITMEATISDKDFIITISDKSHGMEPQQIASAMQPFVSEKIDKLGMGLYLASNIAALHGGKLLISSELLEGTRVMIRCPIVTPTEKQKAIRTQMIDYMGNRFSLPYIYLSEYRYKTILY